MLPVRNNNDQINPPEYSNPFIVGSLGVFSAVNLFASEIHSFGIRNEVIAIALITISGINILYIHPSSGGLSYVKDGAATLKKDLLWLYTYMGVSQCNMLALGFFDVERRSFPTSLEMVAGVNLLCSVTAMTGALSNSRIEWLERVQHITQDETCRGSNLVFNLKFVRQIEKLVLLAAGCVGFVTYLYTDEMFQSDYSIVGTLTVLTKVALTINFVAYFSIFTHFIKRAAEAQLLGESNPLNCCDD